MLKSKNFATSITQQQEKILVVPASKLDNILALKDAQIEHQFFSPYTGEKITNWPDFYQAATKNVQDKIYTTTDHLFIRAKVGEHIVCYVSLDNSVRANINGYPLKNRLSNLCSIVSTFIENAGGECIIFFSESCRPSFDGGNLNDRKNEMSWFKIRQSISDKCALHYLGECANNDDSSNMAFGISAFCTTSYLARIENVLPRRILTEGFGSATVGIKFCNNSIVWGIQFPLDFKTMGSENMGAKAMQGLCKLMTDQKGSQCAIGDFNTIPGEITQSITNAITPEFEFAVKEDILTFFGAFYDAIIPREGEEWSLLC